jgi:hypothetical protein
MKSFLAALLALCIIAPQARSWNAEGHMVVAQIAYSHLTADVKAQCDALIAVPLTYSSTGTSNFITAACWADDFKNNLNTANWHYIDIPFSLDGTSLDGFAGDSFDVVKAIRACNQFIGNPSMTQSNRAVFLRYLIHFVGDIHQPLHASDAISASSPSGDGGGNGFLLTGSYNNLHSLWDAGGGFVGSTVGRPLSASGKTTISNKAAVVEAAYPYNSNAGTIEDPMIWALEGWSLAQTVAYVGITNNTTPTTDYTTAAQSVSQQRLALGGYRLADLLNTIFTYYPAIIQPKPATNNTVSFSWNAVPGRPYKIQSKQDLNDAWTDLTTIQSSTNIVTFTEPASSTTKYYRITE